MTTIACSVALAAVAGCSGIGAPSGTGTLPGGGPAPTADAAVRATPVVPGRPARVFVFAGFGDKCEQLPAPQISVTHPPQKGDISFVPNQETRIETSSQGTCLGRTIHGTGVYYTARAGQQGSDRFTVTATLASGETASRTFEVRLAE